MVNQLTDAQVQEFQTNGCLMPGVVLTDAEVEALRTDLMKVIDRETEREPLFIRNLGGDDAHPVWQIVNIWKASDAFEDLVYHPGITTIVAQAMQAQGLRLWHDQIQYKPAEAGGVNMWHQDGPLWPPLADETMVTAWIALDDVDESNGCMSMVPGSHKWGDQQEHLNTIKNFDDIGTPVRDPKGNEAPRDLWPVPKGGLSLHHCLTWHGSHSNTSGRPRRAIALHYMVDGTRHHAAGQHVMTEFITAGDGEAIQDDEFLLVYKDGRPVRDAVPA